MAIKLPPHFSPHLRHLPLRPQKRPSSQELFRRGARLRKSPDSTTRTRPSLDDEYYWQRGSSTSDPSLLQEVKDVSKEVKKAVHDVEAIAKDPSKALPHGPFRSEAEAVIDAIETAEKFFTEKLVRAMGDVASGGGGGSDTSDTWDEAIDFFETNK
jgi:hypothetical protein